MALFQINDFSGKLTRKRIGSMNSGMARLGRAHSVAPFYDPPTLSYNETATNLDSSHTTFTDLVVDAVENEENGTLYLYSVDRSGKVYKTNTTTDVTTVITSSLGITLKYGGGIRVLSYGGTNQLIVSHDLGATILNIDGTGVSNIQNGFNVNGSQSNVSSLNSQIGDSTGALFGTSGNAQYNFGSLYTGMPLQWITQGGNANPLVSGTTYYVIVEQNYYIKLATTYANAIAGTAITISSVDPSFTFNLTSPNTWGSWIPNIPHPISDEFFGGIFIGNGPDLVDYNIAGKSVKTNRLTPTFPKNYTINTLEVDAEGRYLRIGATTGTTQDVLTADPTGPTQTPISRTVYWNGQDDTYDSMDPFSQTNTNSAYSFLGTDITFGQDFFGAGIFNNQNGPADKLMAMKYIRAALTGAITSTGNMLLFGVPYYVQNKWLCGIFGLGKLDDQDDSAFYPLLGITPSGNNTICSVVGMLRLVQNRYLKSDGTYLTNSKLYVSTYETGGTAAANMYSFNLTPGSGTPNAGVYETQIEYFPMLQQIDRLSIYMTPSSTGVSFKIELVDIDDTIPTGASFTYTYQAGTDPTKLQGALENIDWGSPGTKTFQAMGLRITNLGTVQPSIHQILIETHDAEKAQTQGEAIQNNQ